MTGRSSPSDDLRDRLISHIDSMELPRAILSDGVIKLIADDMADALLPFIRAEVDKGCDTCAEIEQNLARVQAERDSRRQFREKLAQSSLGDPEATEAIARHRRYTQALPDRWVQLRRVDLIGLFEEYRERREVRREDHDDALEHVLAEVDFEPNQDDLFDQQR